jgi:hypothetical protein
MCMHFRIVPRGPWVQLADRQAYNAYVTKSTENMMLGCTWSNLRDILRGVHLAGLYPGSPLLDTLGAEVRCRANPDTA